jgi:aryl-alcohol dehydrogenase-like predicted oxidoreductase
MERSRLGSSSLEVSRLALGTMTFGWTADEAESFRILDAYRGAGGNFLDTADIYARWARGNTGGESETVIGRWLKARGCRDEMVIATKVRGRMWPGSTGEGLGRDHVRRACDYSLKRLGIETIDLYQCHWFDETVPFDETLRAFEELIGEGKVRCIGLSNYPPERLSEALALAGRAGLPAIASLQPHYNLVYRAEFEGPLQDLCLEHNVGVIPYSPLAKGLLSGRYTPDNVRKASRTGVRDYATDKAWATVEVLRGVAARQDVPVAAAALAWLSAQPAVAAPIMGARSLDQLREQLHAAALRLPDADLAALDAVSR